MLSPKRHKRTRAEQRSRRLSNARAHGRSVAYVGCRRREKCFGYGRPRPLDRNAKVRIDAWMRALMKRTEPGMHYGELSAKAAAVGKALLWVFHNVITGFCHPAYKAIAAAADCALSTVYEAIRMLESAGVLGWVNRIERRLVDDGPDLFGRATRVRVLRTSNGYFFHDTKERTAAPTPTQSSKLDLRRGTTNQDSISKKISEIWRDFAAGRITENEAELRDTALRMQQNGRA